MKRNTLAGYSLLEIIVVLGIIGVILVPVSRFMINRIEDNKRQQIADSIVDEMYRFIDFINSDELELEDGNYVRNPLFQINSNELEYKKRVDNFKLTDQITNEGNQLNWNNRNSRRYFIDKSCNDSLLNYNLKNEYLKCQIDPLISNSSSLTIQRIDLVGIQDKRTIERIDFMVLYHAIKPDEAIQLDNYYHNFIQAIRNKALYLTQADILVKKRDANENWELLLNNGKNIYFGEIVSGIDAFNSNSVDYGIRFSFNIKAGKFLKSDGSVNTDKLCWNTKQNQYGPCLHAMDENKLVITSGETDLSKKVPALCWDRQNKKETTCLQLKEIPENLPITDAQFLDDSNFMLTKKDDRGNEVTGTIVANVILEDNHYEGNQLIKGYRTVPEISYHNFTNQSESMIVNENYSGDHRNEPGKIVIPQKKCPVVGNVRLWPRLTLAVSSMSPAIFKDNKLDVELSKEYHTRQHKIKNTGIAAGVILQPANSFINGKYVWVITASLGVNDPTTGKSNTYINPKSLSVMAVEWCSTVKGDYPTALD